MKRNRYEPNAVKDWSVYQLEQEQNDFNLQRVHEKYYPNWNLAAVRYAADKKANESLLNPQDIIKTGCLSMEKPANCGE